MNGAVSNRAAADDFHGSLEDTTGDAHILRKHFELVMCCRAGKGTDRCHHGPVDSAYDAHNPIVVPLLKLEGSYVFYKHLQKTRN